MTIEEKAKKLTELRQKAYKDYTQYDAFYLFAADHADEIAKAYIELKKQKLPTKDKV